jgi:Kef-type K+ transport system membrane component KefB
VFIGATLTATSVGITARVLADLGRLQDPAAKVVLGAAVVDDILGLIILAVVTGIARSGSVSLATVGLMSAKAVVFLLVAIWAGVRLAPVLIGWIGQLHARGTLIVYSMIFAVAMAAVADLIGLATIIGAFAAGLVLATTERREQDPEPWAPVGGSARPRYRRGDVGGRGGFRGDLEPDLEPNRPEKRNRALRRSRSARFVWWAVKDSNLGPAD